ncbi:oxidative stress survival, Svf1-like protein [Rhizopogon vinicolor AM-OR11-026]|uniref:Oxidative stress survival, Svf1-like protein n=1 Tax=Rhizopogon vinicolor AM-OR11-026 TaxID=1314800 RepID=A0A1B7MHF4_9AGAM|nr:oxidative stress survival, Svf1-like protein [Rhizopogon vinicolor AM-OR11-026]
MFSSIFSTAPPVDPKAPNLFPVSEKSDLRGELEPKDLEWTCAGGFTTETQIFYNLLQDGTMLMCQVIHSSIGLWYPTIQFTCKIYNPTTKETIWRSVNVTNFVTPPPGLDKRSSKADQFSITYKPSSDDSHSEMYTIRANLSDNLQISLDVSRPSAVPGFKIGKGPKGGYSYFGPDQEKPEGYVVHRFWPRTSASGHIIHNGKAIIAEGHGMLVHAIQGMRPNLIASRWNFANFQSDAHGGVSAIQMEFTTLDTHGRSGAGSGPVTVSVGSLVLGGKLAVVTAETRWSDEPQPEKAAVMSRTHHLNPVHDPDTGYMQPTALEFRWAGSPLLQGVEGSVDAFVHLDVGSPSSPKGLIEKVDVLAEIPYVIKTMVNYVAGTKPYIYQWQDNAKLSVRGPDAILPGLSEGLDVEGVLYTEASFIS